MMGCTSTRPLRGTGAHSPSFLASSPHASSTPLGLSIHVGRAGNVDLSSRKMDFLGPKIVSMIQDDTLHRKATSLTLTDNILYTLGKELTLLPELEEIDMDANKFQRLPESLISLPNLWRINASANPLNAERGFDVVSRLHALRSLTLRACDLTCVPDRLRECVTLEELDFADNPRMRISDFDFAELTKLRKLSVVNCNLSGDSLPEGMKHNKLIALDISGNNFTFEDNNFFGTELPGSLQELHLCNMELTSVPQVVIVLKRLSFLDLAENPIETLDVLAGRLVKRFPRVRSGSTINTQMSKEGSNVISDNHDNDVDNENHQHHSEGSPLPPGNGSVHSRSEGSIQKATKNNIMLDAPNATNSNVEKIVDDDSDNYCNNSNDDDDEIASNVASEGEESETSRISMSKVSKAGIVATISQPIHLKKLSLRACGLRTVPKYFHKMDFIEELDLSENNQLNDPNMTLFSLSKLRVLNITGCPFAINPTRSNNEWFDIAKLSSLVDLQWEIWRGVHNATLYRTRIPLEICGLPLTRINEVPLRQNLFVGDTVETAVNLFRDGYYKVDLSMDDKTVYSYGEALKTLLTSQPFFFSSLSSPYFSSENVLEKTFSNNNSNDNSNNSSKTSYHFAKINELHLRIAINRYIFFLALQTANYDAVIIPPLDVMTIHMSQLTISPLKYRSDCEAISGRILNCNYRNFFIEEQRHAAAARDATAASKKIWNLMVRSAQRDLKWLRYDFWEKLARISFASTHGNTSNTHHSVSGNSDKIVSNSGERVSQDDNKVNNNNNNDNNNSTSGKSSNNDNNTTIPINTTSPIRTSIVKNDKCTSENTSKGVTFAVDGIAEHRTSPTGQVNETSSTFPNSPNSPQPFQSIQDAVNVNTHNATTLSSSSSSASSNILPLPSFTQRTEAELRNYEAHLCSFDSNKDLAGVLDQAITIHFSEQGEANFRETLQTFFTIGATFVRHEAALRALRLSWTRYAKFLVLYAYRINIQNVNDGTVIMEPTADADGNLYAPQTLSSVTPTYFKSGIGHVRRTRSALMAQYNSLGNSFENPAVYLPRPPMSTASSKHNSSINTEKILDTDTNDDAQEDECDSGVGVATYNTTSEPYRALSNLSKRSSALTMALTRRKSSVKDNSRIAAMRAFTVNPVPTLGITLLLHVHRTSHVRYYQTLSLLGIEAIDVAWEETHEAIKQTRKAWNLLYDEAYLGRRESSQFSTLFISGETIRRSDSSKSRSGKRAKYCSMNDNDVKDEEIIKIEHKRVNSKQKNAQSTSGDSRHENINTSEPSTPQPAVYDAKAISRTSARAGKKGNESVKGTGGDSYYSNGSNINSNEKKKRRVFFCSGDVQYGVFEALRI